MRNTDAPAWDNALINFDHYRWFPAPNYVVMRMFRHCFAPLRIGLGSEAEMPFDAVATASEDGGAIYLKMVNPSDGPLNAELHVEGQWKPRQVELRVVAADSLDARNTLDGPDVVAEKSQPLEPSLPIRVTLPPYSAAVVGLYR